MTGPVRRIDAAQRRARLGRRHWLASGAPDPVSAARGMIAYHATDPASVHIAAAVRTGLADTGVLERALYEERTLVRMLGMRRTMFVPPTDLMPVIQAACADAIAVRERRKAMQLFGEAGLVPDIESWWPQVEADTLKALARRGEATAAELGEDVPWLREQITMAKGKPYEGKLAVSGRVLFLLAAEGKVVRARPNGTWVSSQYRWTSTETWLPGVAPVPVETARTELIRSWLAAFGPGTVADLKWWTGWTLGEVRKTLAGMEVAEVELDGDTGLVLADDVDPVEPPDPWVALLPALDATPMGWFGRDFYLTDECRAAIFDRNGNIGPSVWCDGRIVGGWAQRPDASVAYELVEKVDARTRKRIDAVADQLTAWFDGARPTPRFRTPLEKKLAAG